MLEPTDGADSFVPNVSAARGGELTLIVASNHWNDELAREVECEVAFASYMFSEHRLGLTLRPKYPDPKGPSDPRFKSRESDEPCDDLVISGRQTGTMGVKYQLDFGSGAGLNCRDSHGRPDLMFVDPGRAALATLAHEIGHGFELCHREPGDVGNLMLASWLERSLTPEQSAWAGTSVQSVAGDSHCCFGDPNGPSCDSLSLHPGSSCRADAASAPFCPNQAGPPVTSGGLGETKRVRAELRRWLLCYDCGLSELRDLAPISSDLKKLIFESLASPQAFSGFKDTLETYLREMHGKISRWGCELEEDELVAAYLARFDRHRKASLALAAVVLLSRDELALLLKSDLPEDILALIKQYS